MVNALRTGAWLTRERTRVYCLLLLFGYALSIATLVATSDGKLDRYERPLGADFSEVYAAGVSVLRGEPEKPFNNAAHFRTQKEIFGPNQLFYAWSYPPFFLAVAALFAFAPYLGALAAWQASSFFLCFSAVRKIVRSKEQLLPALAFPGSFINLINGQNGFLTAGLYCWSLILLERRPVVAGLFIGLLTYKPQFGILIPVALLAGGYWRTILSASATVATMALATWLGFGPAVWRAFFDSTWFARVVMTEQGATGFAKIQTIFSTVRQLGGSISAAYAAQGIAACVCAGLVAVLWRRRADWRLKSAALIVGALLTTPYALDYDLVLLGPAVAFVSSFVADRGVRDWEKTLLAAVWATPLFARMLSMAVHVSIGSVAATALLLAVWRAATRTGAAGAKAPAAGSIERDYLSVRENPSPMFQDSA